MTLGYWVSYDLHTAQVTQTDLLPVSASRGLNLDNLESTAEGDARGALLSPSCLPFSLLSLVPLHPPNLLSYSTPQ